jgi:hypothetical protein
VGSEELRALVHVLKKDNALAGLIISRIQAISETDIDHRYENPWDVALAAYLLALRIADPALAPLAAEVVLSVPLTWWARHFALSVLEESDHRDQASTTYATCSTDLPFRTVTAKTTAPEMASDLAVHGARLMKFGFTKISRSWRASSGTSMSMPVDGGTGKARPALSSSNEQNSGTQIFQKVA